MKANILKTFAAAVLLLSGSTLAAQAQDKASQVLGSLQFEAPKALYMVKGKTANIRDAANTAGKKTSILSGWSYRTYVNKGILLGDMGSEAEWITFRSGGKDAFISKSVLTEVQSGPISTSAYNRHFAWIGPDYGPEDNPEDVTIWRVGVQSGGAGLAVGELSYFSGVPQLLLGKKIGNVLSFKYAVPCRISADVDTGGKPYLIEYNAEQGYSLYVSEELTTEVDGFTQPDLTKFTNNMLYQIFRDVIEKDVQTHYFINSIMLGDTYAEGYECL